ncbi:hypothetical protein PENTCL1PPCAC_8787, partial [Pristionchus entomophagus]
LGDLLQRLKISDHQRSKIILVDDEQNVIGTEGGTASGAGRLSVQPARSWIRLGCSEDPCQARGTPGRTTGAAAAGITTAVLSDDDISLFGVASEAEIEG